MNTTERRSEEEVDPNTGSKQLIHQPKAHITCCLPNALTLRPRHLANNMDMDDKPTKNKDTSSVCSQHNDNNMNNISLLQQRRASARR
jgi:hypothetical protein